MVMTHIVTLAAVKVLSLIIQNVNAPANNDRLKNLPLRVSGSLDGL